MVILYSNNFFRNLTVNFHVNNLRYYALERVSIQKQTIQIHALLTRKLSSRFSSNSEASASELSENLVEISNGVISRFKSSITHWCVTRHERVNNTHSLCVTFKKSIFIISFCQFETFALVLLGSLLRISCDFVSCTLLPCHRREGLKADRKILLFLTF